MVLEGTLSGAVGRTGDHHMQANGLISVLCLCLARCFFDAGRADILWIRTELGHSEVWS